MTRLALTVLCLDISRGTLGPEPCITFTVIKNDEHLRTRGKRRKHEPRASVSYISRVFSNVWSTFITIYNIDRPLRAL